MGAVYKARVTKKHIGLNACFVDIGQDNSAFLYIGKNFYEKSDREMKDKKAAEKENSNEKNITPGNSEKEVVQNIPIGRENSTDKSGATQEKGQRKDGKIIPEGYDHNEEQSRYLKQLKTDHTLMVQVIKDPLKTKTRRG